MKKSLLASAIATMVAAPVMAQNVTVSGNLDFAYSNVSGTQLISNGTTVSTQQGVSSTSVINIQAVEDLGGGMRVTAKYGLDPRTLADDSLSTSNNTAANAATGTLGAIPTGLGRDEVFVGLSGAFGNIRLGSPNSIGLNAFQVSSYLGTGIGSGYGPTASTMTNSFVATRYSRSVRYDSPTMNGLTFSVLYAPGNDNPVVAGDTASGGRTAFPFPNARASTELGLRFVNGPLTLNYARIQNDIQSNNVGFYGGSATGVGGKTSVDMVDASVVMGKTSVAAGWHRGDQRNTTAAGVPLDTQGYRVSLRQDMGTYDVIAQYTKFEQDATATQTAAPSVIGLRADYKLSKTAAIYAGYESWQTDRTYASTASTGRRNMGAMGLRKSF